MSLVDNSTPSENTANDLFAIKLNYQINGNIRSWKIQNRGFAALTNTYSYDNLQRITYASNDTQQETFTYRDPLGNFNTIVRSDLAKSGGNWTSQSMDNLAFTYANTKTNRISSIADASNNKLGYVPNNGAYSYDGNGNTTFDPSRGLTLTNNFLNLPSKFTKADGSKQEVIYDATGHKWQEKTYAANNGILLAQKTYLENMEFEGNELSLIHHPTGFVRKLNSANHLSGTQNGDAQGKTISSTQKIGEGRYTAIDQVTLLPGFEATAKDAFLAKIGSVSAYQWQYVLKDHLGNQRALFTDKNGDGLLQQSTNENLNEVLALRNYSAFGLELGGSNQNINYQNPYKYTGKEENSFTGYYDFGARWSDPTIGNRFLQVDPLAEITSHLSLYQYGNLNPILFNDPTGMVSQRIQDFDGNWHEVSGNDMANVYTEGGEDPPSKKTKEPTYLYNEKGEKVYRDGRPYYDLDNIPTIFEMDTRSEDDPTRLVDDFLAFFSPYKALEGLMVLAKLNPLRKAQAASHLTKSAIKEVTIQFGRTPNQIYHTFRHTDELGLDKTIVQKAVEAHLKMLTSEVVQGKPFNQVIEISGRKIQYTAFKVSDEVINVGRIHEVK